MDTAGSRNGISVDWKAWYRSDLPGQTVPITWLFLSSWWNQEPLSWSMTCSSTYWANVAYQLAYISSPVAAYSVAEVFNDSASVQCMRSVTTGLPFQSVV